MVGKIDLEKNWISSRPWIHRSPTFLSTHIGPTLFDIVLTNLVFNRFLNPNLFSHSGLQFFSLWLHVLHLLFSEEFPSIYPEPGIRIGPARPNWTVRDFWFCPGPVLDFSNFPGPVRERFWSMNPCPELFLLFFLIILQN